MLHRLFLLISALGLGLTNILNAQYVKIGDESFINNQNGPLFQDVDSLTESRFVYLFPSSVLGNLVHGDTIHSVEFIRSAGNAIANGELNIYLKNTTLSDFGSGRLSWSGTRTGATLVYSQSPTTDIGNTQKYHLVPFNNQKFYYDTTKGKNLILMVEWKQKRRSNGTIFWFFENNFSVNQYQNNQTKFYRGSGTAPDSLSNSSDVHPSIIFNFPRFDKDLEVIKVYSLGKNPVPLGNPDSVRALVRNVGKKALNGQKIGIYLRGKNQLSDTGLYNLGLGEQKFVTLPSQFPSNLGLDTVIVKAIGDDNAANNTARSLRLENANMYSYRDISNPAGAGGIGFNGSTGDFVAKFLSNKAKSINQVTVHFALNGRTGRIGIWDAKGRNGLPGKLLYESRTFTTTAGNFILDLDSAVKVSGSFYVGVRQTTTNNIAFGYQDENPVRPNTFYFAAPLNDTNWVDFSPEAPFRFFIEPRLQADTDITVLNVWVPRDSIDILSTDTMAPRVEIGNIGTVDAKDSFEIWMQVSQFGNVIYREKVRDTLKAGRKKIVTLKKSLYPSALGDYEVTTWVNRNGEQVRDNDTLRTAFFAGVKRDIRCDAVFDPINGGVYEYGLDTFFPVVRIRNVGYDNIPNFNTRCIVNRGNQVLYNQTFSTNLAKFASRIISFPLYRCNDTGSLLMRFITEFNNDKDRRNDTQFVKFNVVTTYEASVDSIEKPAKNIIASPGISIKPVAKFSNNGLLPFSNAKAIIRISSAYTSYRYQDTITLGTINAKESNTYSFNRNFTPPVKGSYRVVVRVQLPGDLFKSNDSLVHFINVGKPNDYISEKVVFPTMSDTIILSGGPYAPKAVFKNNGFIKESTNTPVTCQIWRGSLRVYQSIKNVNIDTGKSLEILFDKTFIPFTPDTFKVIAYANHISDFDRKNDTSISYCFTKTATDPFAESVISPKDNDTFYAEEDSISIIGRIGNKGYSRTGVVSVYAEIIKNQQLVHYEKFTLNKLESREIINITFTKKGVLRDSGEHQLRIITHSSDNQSIFNDTAYINIFGKKRHDPYFVKSISPKSDTNYLQFDTLFVAGLFKNIGQEVSSEEIKTVWTIYTLPDDIVIHRDTVTFILNSLNQEVTGTGIKPWIMNLPGNYSYEAHIIGTNLRYKNGDTIKGRFTVDKKISVKDDVTKNEINVFPNPWTAGSLQIQTNLPEGFGYEIYDLNGKLIRTGDCNTPLLQLNEWNASNGWYIIKVVTLTGQVYPFILRIEK